MKQHPGDLEIASYDYPLTEDRIAKYPLEQRDHSKLLIYKEDEIRESAFKNISQELPENALLLFNETKVIQARLQFFKDTGAKIEIFCLEPLAPTSEIQMAFEQKSAVVWKCFIGNSKKWKSGKLTKKLSIEGLEVEFYAEKKGMDGEAHLVAFSWEPNHLVFSSLLSHSGLVPLPPYLNREAEKDDKDRYQTIYAKQDGSVAAPTAGLHFTDEVFDSLESININIEKVTLHVGAGTFKPVSSDQIGDHEMHTEKITISKSTIENLLDKKKDKIIVVGTTTMRTLESLYWYGVKLKVDENALFKIDQWDPYQEKYQINDCLEDVLRVILGHMNKYELEVIQGETQLMIAPGYDFKVADILITNFHQPKSTLLLLVSAFLDGNWENVYDYAINNDFRFLSYGDSCLLFKK